MAKPSGTSQLLVLALFLSVGLAVILCYRYVEAFSRASDLQTQSNRLQVQSMQVNRNRLVIQNLAKEVVDYARKTPALQGFVQQYTPLYQQLNLIPANPAPAPAVTPPTQ
jgi:hypothetical protein